MTLLVKTLSGISKKAQQTGLRVRLELIGKQLRPTYKVAGITSSSYLIAQPICVLTHEQ